MSSNCFEVDRALLDNQKDIMQEVKRISDMRGAKPLAYVDTYGCQQNESDSEKLRGMLINMGYDITPDEFEADVAILNTCAIRQNAENRVLGNVGALKHTKKAKPSQIVVFCGCLAAVPETVEKIRKSYHQVSLVFPPSNIWKFPQLLHSALSEKKRVFDVENAMDVIAEGLPSQRDSKIKAWLPIMYGCDNFCAYCIVPYVRGRERSRRSEEVYKEAIELVLGGYKDITLLGQNVNSYGKGLSENIDFAALISKIGEIDGEFLVRFMTSHPKDASEKLFEAMASSDKIARHIHLPFQAGSDRVLKLMNRGYSAAEFLKKLDIARKHMPDIVITSDVIVGYPGETMEEFEDTLRLVEIAQFEAMFTFIYSIRPGTTAAKLNDDVTREEKQERFERLVSLQNEISDKKHAEYIGKTVKVLVDTLAGGEEYPLKARTNGGRLVHLKGSQADFGKFVDAKVTHCNNWALYGQI